MVKIKLQHYVPRFYLKNFSKLEGKNHILKCFDKSEEKQFDTDIKNVACEKFFYDEEMNGEQLVEKKLSQLEGLFNQSIKKLIKLKNPDKLSVKDRGHISLFLAIQYIRTKETREMIRDSIKQLKKKLSKRKLSRKLRQDLKEVYTDKSIKSIHINTLKNSLEFADVIYNMKWIIALNRTKTPFWTSDNPIALHNEINHTPYGNLGLTCLGIELHLPLTPNLLLITCDPIAFCKEPSKKILRDFRYIIRELSYQVYSATRFIFSNNPDFTFAKKVIKENPIYKDPNRKRIVVN